MAKAEDKNDVKVTPVAPVVAVKPKKEKSYSFEQWAQLRKKMPRHMRGMRAFLGDKSSFKYSLEKWDEIFKTY